MMNSFHQFSMIKIKELFARFKIKTFIILLQLNKKRPNRFCQKQLSQVLDLLLIIKNFCIKYERYKLRKHERLQRASQELILCFVFVGWASEVVLRHYKIRAVDLPMLLDKRSGGFYSISCICKNCRDWKGCKRYHQVKKENLRLGGHSRISK